MPKCPIDYSNTVIYKIFCKDSNITDIYVGHTTNFSKRKYTHRQMCKNEKNTTNIYKVIRNNGGWDNWDMVIINTYNCKNATEARQKEHQYYLELKPTMNTTPPCSLKIPVTKDNQTIKYEKTETNSGKDGVSTVNYKYKCDMCKYSTIRLSQWNRHLDTMKHISLTSPVPEATDTKYKCNNCNRNYHSRTTLWRHKKYCLPVEPPNYLNELAKVLIEERIALKQMYIELFNKLLSDQQPINPSLD